MALAVATNWQKVGSFHNTSLRNLPYTLLRFVPHTFLTILPGTMAEALRWNAQLNVASTTDPRHTPSVRTSPTHGITPSLSRSIFDPTPEDDLGRVGHDEDARKHLVCLCFVVVLDRA